MGDLAPEKRWEGSKAHVHLAHPALGPQYGCASRLLVELVISSITFSIPLGHSRRNFLNQVFPRAVSPRSPHSSGNTRGLGAARPSKALCLSFPSGYPRKIALRGDVDASVVGRPRHDSLRAHAAAHGCTPAGAGPSGEEGMTAAGGVTVPCCPSPACLMTASPVPTGLLTCRSRSC